MTGTPTKTQQISGELGQVKCLLRFLEHGFFTQRLDGNMTWKQGIVDHWRAGNLVGWFRLQALLRLLMKRHTKLDIEELPAPVFKKSVIPMSRIEVTTYNTLVCGVVKSNIATTGMDGVTSGAQDSLLHRSQAKHARVALANVRRVCVGYSRVVPTLEVKHFVETVQMLEMHGRSESEIENVRQYMHRAEAQELTKCGCCPIELSTMLLFPCCGGLLCPECFDGSNECMLCDQVFNIDDFQLLQPGFALDWKENLSVVRHPPRRAPTTPNPNAIPVPANVAPAQVVNDGLVDNVLLLAPNGVLLPAQQELRRTRRFGDGHDCVYSRAVAHGRCLLCFTEHDRCQLINRESRCQVCHRQAEDCTEEESKSYYLVTSLLDLYHKWHDSSERPLKVIVFSQFRQGLNMAGSNLLRRFGSACVAEYWGKYRTDELQKFAYDPECFCMLLGRDGSEGLDLSFVTHIFFLEEVMDQELKDQTVARAWRMGATGRVVVETLVAQLWLLKTYFKISNPSFLRSRERRFESIFQGILISFLVLAYAGLFAFFFRSGPVAKGYADVSSRIFPYLEVYLSEPAYQATQPEWPFSFPKPPVVGKSPRREPEFNKRFSPAYSGYLQWSE